MKHIIRERLVLGVVHMARGAVMTPWQKLERLIFLICVIVLALDLLVWRPN